MKTDREAADILLALSESRDLEVTHRDADDLLCELLDALGYTETVKAFDKLDKWYA